MHKTRIILTAAAAVAVAFSGVARADKASDKNVAPAQQRNDSLDKKVEQQVEPALKQFETAWNKEDPKAMASSFASDAVVVNPEGRIARGQEQVAKLFEDEKGPSGEMRGSKFKHQVVDARQIAPGLAVIDEQVTISGMKKPAQAAGTGGAGGASAAGEMPPFDVHVTILAQKQGDQWKALELRAYRFMPVPQTQQNMGGAGEAGH